MIDAHSSQRKEESSLSARAGELLRDSIAQYGITDDDTILIACSGGRDSLALVATACHYLRCHIGAVIVNHQLQTRSREVADTAARTCEDLGCDFVTIVDVTVEQTRAGLESDARDARYDALVSVAHEKNVSLCFVAHTRNDVAETMLIKLLRTPAIEALTGIREEVIFDGVHFVRPFLELTREDTTSLCREFGIDYWDDPTNGDAVVGELGSKYPVRSQVRHDVIPLLNRVTGRDSVQVLANATVYAQDDLDIIENATTEAYERIIREKNGITEIKIRPLHTFLPAVQRRVIIRALENNNILVTKSLLSEILQLSRVEQKKKSIKLNSTLRVNKIYDVIQLWKDRDYANF